MSLKAVVVAVLCVAAFGVFLGDLFAVCTWGRAGSLVAVSAALTEEAGRAKFARNLAADCLVKTTRGALCAYPGGTTMNHVPEVILTRG